MSISGVGGNMPHLYKQLASGKKINSAGDNAAGLKILEKLTSQRNGYDVGTRNAGTALDMSKVADGALGSITDSLQRIRELSVQASSSAIYGSDDVSSMQSEIDQLKEHISSVAQNTQFNGQNILDGSKSDFHIATNPDGSGTTMMMPNSALAALGIENYDVTGGFDISDIDRALDMVSSNRSGLGAASNGLEHTINYNQNASYNLTASKSRIEDLDYGKAVSDEKKNQILEQYRLNMQKKQNDEYGRVVQLMKL